MGVRIKDRRESEGLSVMERIEIETLSQRENAQTSTGSIFTLSCKEA